jgi:hypothetical protein
MVPAMDVSERDFLGFSLFKNRTLSIDVLTSEQDFKKTADYARTTIPKMTWRKKQMRIRKSLVKNSQK